jgi:hypothetical protein
VKALQEQQALLTRKPGSTIPACKPKSKPSAFAGLGSTKCFFGGVHIKRGFMMSTGRLWVVGPTVEASRQAALEKWVTEGHAEYEAAEE